MNKLGLIIKRIRDMKREGILMLMLVFGMAAYSQPNPMVRVYEYDGAGNRVVRKVFEIQSASSVNLQEPQNEEDGDESAESIREKAEMQKAEMQKAEGEKAEGEKAEGEKAERKKAEGEKAESGNAESGAEGLKGENFLTDEVGDIQLKVFPNPATSIVYIRIEEVQTISEGIIWVYNANGGLLSTQRFVGQEVNIDLSSYTAGIYLVNIRINGKETKWKIVKK